MPAAIANKDWVGYWVATSSQVFKPTTAIKMAPVAIIPTTMAANISRKCRQNGDTCRLRSGPLPDPLHLADLCQMSCPVSNDASGQAADRGMKRLGEDTRPPRQRGPSWAACRASYPCQAPSQRRVL